MGDITGAVMPSWREKLKYSGSPIPQPQSQHAQSVAAQNAAAAQQQTLANAAYQVSWEPTVFTPGHVVYVTNATIHPAATFTVGYAEPELPIDPAILKMRETIDMIRASGI